MSKTKFCEALEEQEAKAALERFAKVQAKAALERFGKVQTPRITCPRCGKPTIKEPLHTNALSRFVDVYVCDMCRMAEALIAHAGQPPRLRNWAIIETVRELFDE